MLPIAVGRYREQKKTRRAARNPEKNAVMSPDLYYRTALLICLLALEFMTLQNFGDTQGFLFYIFINFIGIADDRKKLESLEFPWGAGQIGMPDATDVKPGGGLEGRPKHMSIFRMASG